MAEVRSAQRQWYLFGYQCATGDVDEDELAELKAALSYDNTNHHQIAPSSQH
jgi:hypothetical protein